MDCGRDVYSPRAIATVGLELLRFRVAQRSLLTKVFVSARIIVS